MGAFVSQMVAFSLRYRYVSAAPGEYSPLLVSGYIAQAILSCATLEACGAIMESRYLAFLLRVWQVNSDDDAAWRASLENPHTGERHAFATLDDLFMFLGAETRALAHQGPVDRRVGQEKSS